MGDEKRSLKRSEIDEKYKWAINDIYATDEKWYEDLEKLKGYIQKTASYKGKLSQSAETLYDEYQFRREL